MNCNEFNEKLFDFIDNELSDTENEAMQKHMDKCESCKQSYNEYNSIISSLHELPMEELPKGYCKRLNNKLKTSLKDAKRRKRFGFIKIASAAAVCIIAVTAIYMNSNGRYDNFYLSKSQSSMDCAPIKTESAEEMPAEAPQAPSSGIDVAYNGSYDTKAEEGKDFVATDEATGDNSLAMRSSSSVKIIKTGNVDVTTENFDEFFDLLSNNIKDSNGYLENSEIYIRGSYNDRDLKSGHLILRVPQNLFDSTMEFIEANSKVNNKSVNENDVTKEYCDKSNIVSNLELQEQKLRELLDRTQNVSEILEVENELRRIRTEIDSYKIELGNIDDRVGMSTINLNITEIEKANLGLSNKSNIWDKCRDGFIQTINSIIAFGEELVILIVSYSPIIIPIIIVMFVVFKKLRKKSK